MKVENSLTSTPQPEPAQPSAEQAEDLCKSHRSTWTALSLLLAPESSGGRGAWCTYLAGIKVPNDLNNDLVVLIRGLVSWHYHFGSSQVLQLIHLGVGQPEKLRAPAMNVQGAEGNSAVECWDWRVVRVGEGH